MLRRGRLERAMDPVASEYISSMQADRRISEEVVQINVAHAIMLAERRIIPERDASAILRALLDLRERGFDSLEARPELEDIHLAVEEFVIRSAGEEVGGRLGVAKSRNDQVATAIRMRLRKDLLEVQGGLLELISSLLALADENLRTIMPGYTHLQVAQPTTLAHYLAAHTSAFLRDVDRLTRAFDGASSCPMGACALAGTSFPIDRVRVSRLLGFERIEENTLDAIGSRDFALEALSALTICATDLSRLAEDLILWSTVEFGMVEVPEEFAATSSIMPQKRNPVVAEIARARASDVVGRLTGALNLMKAVPQSYCLDLQELTPMLWGAVDSVNNSLRAMSRFISAIKPNADMMRKRAELGFAMATDLADLLVREAGLAFREAHAVVGKMVSDAIGRGAPPSSMTVDDLQAASRRVLGREIPVDPAKFKDALRLEKCVEARALPGGPAPKAVGAHLDSLKRAVKDGEGLVQARKGAIAEAERELIEEAKRYARWRSP